jgi:hypothetical protein
LCLMGLRCFSLLQHLHATSPHLHLVPKVYLHKRPIPLLGCSVNALQLRFEVLTEVLYQSLVKTVLVYSAEFCVSHLLKLWLKNRSTYRGLQLTSLRYQAEQRFCNQTYETHAIFCGLWC